MKRESDPTRRSFLTGGWRSLMREAAGDAARSAPPPGPLIPLRPPGALPEPAFLHTCVRSGDCVEACPARAIRVLRDSDPHRHGTPHIVASLQACVVCDELACMKACPSGALRLVAAHDIRMGLAVLRDAHCVRTGGEECRICVEKCPLGERAIGIDAAGRVAVRDPGCVGCGVCEMACPTSPRAIVIEPRRGT